MVSADSDNIRKAAKIIRDGGLVAFPTETVYGLGVDALNPIAVSRLFEAKKRPYFDPLIVHIASLSSIERLVISFNKIAQDLAENFWPGPLTLVLPKSNIIPDIVTSGLPTVAIRMPEHTTALELIKEADTPIAAPSANPFGYISPTKAQHVREQLGDAVDMILDGGDCSIGIESTIIKIEECPKVLRYGGLSIEEIENVVGRVILPSSDSGKLESPGQLTTHYSPRTPVVIVKDIDSLKTEGEKAGLLAFRSYRSDHNFEKIEILSPGGNLREAAANLFSCLYNLDAAGLDIIYAEYVTQNGLGRAIMDRLYKAAKKDNS